MKLRYPLLMKRTKVEKYLAHKITAIAIFLLTNTFLYYVILYLIACSSMLAPRSMRR